MFYEFLLLVMILSFLLLVSIYSMGEVYLSVKTMLKHDRYVGFFKWFILATIANLLLIVVTIEIYTLINS